MVRTTIRRILHRLRRKHLYKKFKKHLQEAITEQLRERIRFSNDDVGSTYTLRPIRAIGDDDDNNNPYGTPSSSDVSNTIQQISGSDSHGCNTKTNECGNSSTKCGTSKFCKPSQKDYAGADKYAKNYDKSKNTVQVNNSMWKSFVSMLGQKSSDYAAAAGHCVSTTAGASAGFSILQASASVTANVGCENIFSSFSMFSSIVDQTVCIAQDSITCSKDQSTTTVNSTQNIKIGTVKCQRDFNFNDRTVIQANYDVKQSIQTKVTNSVDSQIAILQTALQSMKQKKNTEINDATASTAQSIAASTAASTFSDQTVAEQSQAVNTVYDQQKSITETFNEQITSINLNKTITITDVDAGRDCNITISVVTLASYAAAEALASSMKSAASAASQVIQRSKQSSISETAIISLGVAAIVVVIVIVIAIVIMLRKNTSGTKANDNTTMTTAAPTTTVNE